MRKLLVTVAMILTVVTGYMYFNMYQSTYSQVGSLVSKASKSNDANETNDLLQQAKANAQKIGINEAEFFSQI